MALYRDVQLRAHTELDTVVGRDRLPDFDDKDKLPYLGAILKETLRWKAVSPLGLSRCSERSSLMARFQVFPIVPRKRTNTVAYIFPRRRLCYLISR